MQFRKLFIDYPGLATAISIGLLLVALAVVGYQLWARNQPSPGNEPRLKQPPPDETQVQAGSTCPGVAQVSAEVVN